MPAARIDASDLSFPPACVGCGAPPDHAYTIRPTHGFTFIVFEVGWCIDVPVPICAHCRRRRRLVGAAAWTCAMLIVVGGTFTDLQLLMDGRKVAAAILALVIAIGVVLGRLWLDDLVEWTTLGIRVAWHRGDQTPLTVSIRRQAYFSQWASINSKARIVS